ncbi:MAG: GGDEF domain-containing protein, partial [Burkholderiaceae bacterium]
FQLATGVPLANLPLLSTSTFGLWFKHKGRPVFNKDPQADTVVELIASCDGAVQELQRSANGNSTEARMVLLRALHDKAAQIKQLTQSMFEKMTELESGRDELTHLLNRRFLSTVLRREVALSGRGRKSFSIAMIDVDHFKAINDQHGHASGDLALQTVAATLLRNLRVSDYAFRYGGEEFLLLLVETDTEQAQLVGERIRKEIADETVRLPNGATLKLTVSVGIASHLGHPDYARTLAAADTALYRAKALGRNRVEISTPA